MKYYNKSKIPYSQRRIIFISLVTNALFISWMNMLESPEDYMVDKSTAMYARENVDNIISFLRNLKF